MTKLKKNIPNILTMTNMLLGASAIAILIRIDHPRIELFSVALIMLGGIIDFLDGHLARKLDAVTDMGKQLDSFADIITFGIAPVCILHYIYTLESRIFYALIVIASALFLMAGAYRLARYNLGDFSDHFLGLPITFAGIILGVYCALYPFWSHYPHPIFGTVTTLLLIVVLSVMMVSKTKFKRV